MNRLRREKRKLELRIEEQKQSILVEAIEYKNSLWPFRLFGKWKKTTDAFADNKFVAFGAQLAWAALNAMKDRKHGKDEEKGTKKKDDGGKTNEEESGGKNNVVSFLKDMAKNFLEQYSKEKQQE